jgi:hypothetical protein
MFRTTTNLSSPTSVQPLLASEYASLGLVSVRTSRALRGPTAGFPRCRHTRSCGPLVRSLMYSTLRMKMRKGKGKGKENSQECHGTSYGRYLAWFHVISNSSHVIYQRRGVCRGDPASAIPHISFRLHYFLCTRACILPHLQPHTHFLYKTAHTFSWGAHQLQLDDGEIGVKTRTGMVFTHMHYSAASARMIM